MTKSKLGGLSKLPKEQVCSFAIGPVSSWFMPNAIDLWTQPSQQDDNTDCDTTPALDDTIPTSYFTYGSIGCFCLGELHHRSAASKPSITTTNQVGGVVNKLIDVKDDNSRVASVRFQRSLQVPVILALTESGSLLIYDHLLNRSLVHLKKAEVLKRFAGVSSEQNAGDDAGTGQNVKRPRFDVTQQINSCAWPEANNIFLGVSLIKEKKCLLLRLKLNNIAQWRRDHANDSSRNDLICSHSVIELHVDDFSSPICLLESAMLDEKVCLIATATDDGHITVISINLETGKVLRTIKLGHRHNDQICSMSFNLDNRRKHPLGLLASVSRDGLVLIWDVENEFYFADYLALQSADRGSNAKINWFALRFISMPSLKHTYLTVSNAESGLTLLEMPENARSKVRLKDVATGGMRPAANNKKANNQNTSDQFSLKHNALIFNIEYDPTTHVLMTSSLDGNLIIWKANQLLSSSDHHQASPPALEVRQHFLIPAMPNSARTHMLRHSPIREDLLCMALGKAGVRFHSIGDKLIDSKFEMTPSCSLVARRLVKASVNPTSVAWHPNHEYRLAIGTLEGKVYRVDITPRKAALIEAEFSPKVASNQKSEPTIDDALGVDYQPMELTGQQAKASNGAAKNSGVNKQQRPKTDGVYSICWGPHPANSDDKTKHAIYAIGSISHTLSIYYSKRDNSEKLTNYLEEFLDTSLPEATGLASEVAWKSSMDMMALGTTDGRILISSYLDESHQERSKHKLFRRLMTIQGPLGSAFVQCMTWHPTTDKDDPNYYKMAASSNESPAFVFNLRETLLVADVKEQLGLKREGDDPSATTDETSVLSCYANKLKAHEKAITDIAWNPHEPNQLATCSFDRTCYVWSLDGTLMDSRVVAKFQARDRLFTVDWSLVDENLIYTSGHDSVVWAWRPTENRHSLVSV